MLQVNYVKTACHFSSISPKKYVDGFMGTLSQEPLEPGSSLKVNIPDNKIASNV